MTDIMTEILEGTLMSSMVKEGRGILEGATMSATHGGGHYRLHATHQRTSISYPITRKQFLAIRRGIWRTIRFDLQQRTLTMLGEGEKMIDIYTDPLLDERIWGGT